MISSSRFEAEGLRLLVPEVLDEVAEVVGVHLAGVTAAPARAGCRGR